MGTSYYLAREDNRTLFELGKPSSWRSVFFDQTGAFGRVDQSVLAARLLVEFTRGGWAVDDAPAYASEVAHRVVTWANGSTGVRLVNDADDSYADLVVEGYRTTGTRFTETDVAEIAADEERLAMTWAV